MRQATEAGSSKSSGLLARLEHIIEQIMESVERGDTKRIESLKADYAGLFQQLLGSDGACSGLSEGDLVRLLALQKSCMELISNKKRHLMAEMKRCRGTKDGISAYASCQQAV